MTTFIFYTRNSKYKESMINYHQKVLFSNYINVIKESSHFSGNIPLIIASPSKIFPIKMFIYIYYIKEKKLQSFIKHTISYDFGKLIKYKLLLSL